VDDNGEYEYGMQKRCSGRRVYSFGKNVKSVIRKKIVELLKGREEILFAYIHGSFLEGRFRDVDVAIYLDLEGDLRYALNLEGELEEGVGVPVDVRILNSAPLSFRFRVISQGILLFSRDEERRSNFEFLTMAEYHDFNFYREMYRRDVLGIKV
jgi:predicted nucleotidyltransferase